MSIPVGILGGGSFGRGLARAVVGAGRDALLWSQSGHEAGEGVKTTSNLGDMARAELVLIAIPSQHVATVAARLGEHLDGSHLLVHVSRGLVGETLSPLTRVLRAETPCRRVGALAGPLVAKAMEEGTVSGAIVGSRFPEIGEAVREAIGGPRLRVYTTGDVVGVQVASAMVGLLAMAAGFARGVGMGPAALAIMATRGIAEAARVGAALGADERTFSGLAGFGDLTAAVAGDNRPEMAFGEALARGSSVEDAAHDAGTHIEGLSFAGRVTEYAARVGCEAPIAREVASVLDGQTTVEEAVSRLMTRRVGTE